MTEEQQIIAHDAGVWDYRAQVQQFMVLVSKVHSIFGGEPDANALAVAVADELDLWDGEDLPEWVMDFAEWAVEKVQREVNDA